jgi:hypothetical protein
MDAFASGELTENEAVTWLVVMAEVRMTCQRPGSYSKDWFDRKGLVVAWADKHVMKVGNATWAREGMTIELPNGTIEEGALRMQQKIERIKFNMLEGGYEYDMSGTPGTCARSNTHEPATRLALNERRCTRWKREGATLATRGARAAPLR